MNRSSRYCRIVVFLFAFLIYVSSLVADTTQSERILRELRARSGKVVLVVAHRGDWRNFPENTLEAVESAIKMGVDMIEIDVQKTKDGEFVLMHDSTVNRTTNGKGKVADLTLEEIKKLGIRNGIGHITGYRIPTLREIFIACKGRILLNLDKVGSDRLSDVYNLAVEIGVEEQILFKSGERWEKVKPILEKAPKAMFMPILSLDTKNSAAILDEYETHLKPIAYEIIPTKDPSEDSDRLRKIMEDGRHIWFNTLWESLCLGRSDDKAVDDPDANWGWVLDKGATIIQTDRPALLIRYLQSKGRRW